MGGGGGGGASVGGGGGVNPIHYKGSQKRDQSDL